MLLTFALVWDLLSLGLNCLHIVTTHTHCYQNMAMPNSAARRSLWGAQGCLSDQLIDQLVRFATQRILGSTLICASWPNLDGMH